MLSVTDLTRNWDVATKQNLFDDIKGLLVKDQRTYQDIAAAAGVHYQTLENWADGKTKAPQLLKVLAVANALSYDLILVKRRTRH